MSACAEGPTADDGIVLTPTLLFANRDVFGLAVPKPPLPQPT